MISSYFQKCIVLLIITFSLFYLRANSTFTLVDQGENIECIIIQWTTCSKCVNNYETYILPFYKQYQTNDSISFIFIDAAIDWGYFREEMNRREINIYDYGYFPWVIFTWGNNRTIVLDVANLAFIESIFLKILEDPDCDPQTIITNNSFSFELINLELAFISGMTLLITIIITIILGKWFYRNHIKTQILLKRISKENLIVISFLTIISIFILLYQTLDFLNNGCGCIATNIIKRDLLRHYNHIEVFDMAIPFSLLGLISLFVIIIITFLIGSSPIPLKLSLPVYGQITLNRRAFKLFYYFLIIQQLLLLVTIIILVYFELFILNFICLLCTISQVIIILNSIIIFRWRPFCTTNHKFQIS